MWFQYFKKKSCFLDIFDTLIRIKKEKNYNNESNDILRISLLETHAYILRIIILLFFEFWYT